MAIIFYEDERGLEVIDRPELLPQPLPTYAHEWSVHPDSIRVSFADGSTRIYDLRIEQPAPVFAKKRRRRRR